MDSGAFYHITSDLQNLSLSLACGGTDEVIIGDGSDLSVTHIGSTHLHTPSSTFFLSNVLCVPNIKKNHISVSQFCKTNNTSIEFFPSSFIVKDLQMREQLVQGWSSEEVYELPSSVRPLESFVQAMVGIKSSFTTWHQRLGHPSTKIVNCIVQSYYLSISSSSQTYCNACK